MKVTINNITVESIGGLFKVKDEMCKSFRFAQKKIIELVKDLMTKTNQIEIVFDDSIATYTKTDAPRMWIHSNILKERDEDGHIGYYAKDMRMQDNAVIIHIGTLLQMAAYREYADTDKIHLYIDARNTFVQVMDYVFRFGGFSSGKLGSLGRTPAIPNEKRKEIIELLSSIPDMGIRSKNEQEAIRAIIKRVS